jgi:SAM-dependent methyltransferase
MDPADSYPSTVRCSVFALPFRAETFDGVICTEVLEHVPDPIKALEAVREVLRPGGHLYVTVPMTWGLHYEPHDYFRFTKYGLAHLAGVTQYEIEDLTPIGGLFTMILARLEEVFVGGLYRLAALVTPRLAPERRQTVLSLMLFPFVVVLDAVADAADRLLRTNRRDVLGWAVVFRRPGPTGS